MELKQAEIKLRSPGSYRVDQFILDISNGALECKYKTFLSQPQAMKQKWLICDPIATNWTRKSITATITRYYNNMSEDQVIALATRVETLEQEFTITKTTITLTTSIHAQNTTQAGGGNLDLKPKCKAAVLGKALASCIRW